MKRTLMALVAVVTLVLTSVGSQAETAVERECETGKCTCTYIANTCKKWNTTHGGDLAVCDRYREACLASGEYHDRNRHIAPVIRR